MIDYKDVSVFVLFFASLVALIYIAGDWSKPISSAVLKSPIQVEQNAENYKHVPLRIYDNAIKDKADAILESPQQVKESVIVEPSKKVRYVSLPSEDDLSKIAPGFGKVITPYTLALVRKVKKLSQQMLTFKRQYGGIAGDINTVVQLEGNQVEAGNGDGKISDIREALLVWRHLAQAGLITIAAANQKVDFKTLDISRSIPLFEDKNIVVLPIYVPDNKTASKHMLMFSSLVENTFNGGAFSPAQAHQIDVMLDDGFASTGASLEHGGVLAVNGQGHASPCVVGGKYNLTHKHKSCKLYIGMPF